MFFNEAFPYVRFARYLKITNSSSFPTSVPLDCRLFYVFSGTAKIELDSQIVILEKGDSIFINSGFPYQLLPCECNYLAINFDFTNNYSNIHIPIFPVNAKNASQYNLIEHINFDDVSCFDNYYIFKDCHALQNNLIKIESEYSKKMSYYSLEISALFLSVLIFLIRRYENNKINNSRFDFESIIAYIHENYNNEIDNYTLAGIFNFHPNYISAQFKAIIGKPLHRYVLETRILNAISLLEIGTYSIEQIAETVGFNDSNYFIRYFKKIMGTTPKKYSDSYLMKK